VKADPIVVFMKGNVAQPQCGFSKAVCQILEVQGVPPEKIKTYNVLDDPELRDAIKEYRSFLGSPSFKVVGCRVGIRERSGEVGRRGSGA
jgi:monothiol glutaredoxin